MNKKAKDIVGWYGVLAILLAYGLLSFKFIASDSLSYQLLNLTGSLGILVVALARRDTQPAVLEIIWAAIAVIAIFRLLVS